MTFLAGNGEITAANNGGILSRSASAFDFLGVPRVELQGTNGAINLTELHGNDGRASALNEALDESGFVGSD